MFISWVGLRGAVPIILALFPWLSGVEQQELYFDVAFVVVLISLIIQGWTIAPVARWLQLEVPKRPEPAQRMPLASVSSREALEVWSYPIDKDSPPVITRGKSLKLTAPATFVGVIRDGDWLQPETQPIVREGDVLLVTATVKDIDEVSRILASGGKGMQMSDKGFFGDFTLRGDLTIAELASVYPAGDVDESILSMTLNDHFKDKFHRRVVIGDSLIIGALTVTVRSLNKTGDIEAVGVSKRVSRGSLLIHFLFEFKAMVMTR